MPAYLEVWRPEGAELIGLESARVTIGRAATNDVDLSSERSTRDQVVTEGADRAPDLTPREREVLVALFRPAVTSELFAEPASTREIARALAVSEAAVKQHLARLYLKFGIDDGERRQVRLANEALRRGAVNLADIRANRLLPLTGDL